MCKMKPLLVFFVICSPVTEILTISENNSTKELLENTTTILSSATKAPEFVNTSSLATKAVTRTNTNETISKQGELIDLSNEYSNDSDHVLVDSKENKKPKSKDDYVPNNIGRKNKDMDMTVKLERPELHDTNRHSIKNLFKRILAYKHISTEGFNKRKEIEDKYAKAYVLWIIKKFGSRRNYDENVSINQRHKRSVKESAGYTHDAETCKLYNNNLLDMWSNLSKYFDTAERSPPNKSVLHNIGIMIKAYLDHVTPVEIGFEAPPDTLVIRKDRNISSILPPIILEMETIVNNNNKVIDVTVLTFFVLERVKYFREVPISEECINKIDHEITTLINLAFQNYLTNANCNAFIANDDNNNRVIKNEPSIYSEAKEDIFTITNANGYFNTQVQDKDRSDNGQLHYNLLNSRTEIIKRSVNETDSLQLTNTKSLNEKMNNPSMTLDNNPNIRSFKNFDEILNHSNLIDRSLEKSNILRTSKTLVMRLSKKYCSNVATKQLMLILKCILKLYLFNDDCHSERSVKFSLILKLIKGTPIFQPLSAIDINELMKFNTYLQFLENIHIADLNNDFSILTLLENNKDRTEVLKDISYNNTLKNRMPNNVNDMPKNHQNILNDLHYYPEINLPSYINFLNSKIASVTTKPEYKELLLGNLNNNEESFVNQMHSNMPLNIKQYEEKHQLAPNFGKPITLYPLNINTENSESSNIIKFFNALDINDIISSPFRNMSNTVSLIPPEKYDYLVSSPEENSKINYPEKMHLEIPSDINLLNNPSGTYLLGYSVTKPNSDKNPVGNRIRIPLGKGANPVGNNNKIGHPIHIPLISRNNFYNNPVLFNYLNNYNKRALVKNEIKPNFDKSDTSFVHGKPELVMGPEYVKHHSPKTVLQTNVISLNTGDHKETNKKIGFGNTNIMAIKNSPKNHGILINSIGGNTNGLNKSNFENFFHLAFDKVGYNSLSHNHNTSFQPSLDLNNLLQKFSLRNQINHTLSDFSQLNNNSKKYHKLFRNKKNSDTNLKANSIKSESVTEVVDKKSSTVQLNSHKMISVLFNQSQLYDNFKHNKSYKSEKQTEAILNTTVIENNIHKALHDLALVRNPGSEVSYVSSILNSIYDLPAITAEPKSKGDVELIYIFKHPQIVVYQPQFLLKRRISYFDYINNSWNILDNTEKNLRLYKIVRHLPNNTLQILYQSNNPFPILKVQNS